MMVDHHSAATCCWLVRKIISAYYKNLYITEINIFITLRPAAWILFIWKYLEPTWQLTAIKELWNAALTADSETLKLDFKINIFNNGIIFGITEDVMTKVIYFGLLRMEELMNSGSQYAKWASTHILRNNWIKQTLGWNSLDFNL
jgi:hypothetical protein